MANRIVGSPDIFGKPGRNAHASVNFVAAHDGFTLADLVSYREKQNLANLEENRDGHSHNLSNNHGVEGDTPDQAVLDKRFLQRRNMIATLLLSRGVPMILGGDELSRTQQGNNNPYNQDNEVSWFHWELEDEPQSFLDFVRELIALRCSLPTLCAPDFWTSGSEAGDPEPAAWLFDATGNLAGDELWHEGDTLQMQIVLRGTPGPDVLISLNAEDCPSIFSLPDPESGRVGVWKLALLTAASDREESNSLLGTAVSIPGNSLMAATR